MKSEIVVLDDREIVLRRVKVGDVKSLQRYINALVDEDALITFNEKVTLKEEKEFVKKLMERWHVVAEHDGKVVGIVELHPGIGRSSHVFELGVSVDKGFRNIGLGQVLTRKAVEMARENKKVKILFLSVFSVNKNAVHVYEKVGFRKVALLPKRGFYKGGYIDMIVMDYPLNKI
jgi:L-amino acid N-acyltransferase YncA